MTSPSPPPDAESGASTRRSLYQLARLWNIPQGEIYRAAQQLGIPSKMASTVNPATERRLQDHLFTYRPAPRQASGNPFRPPPMKPQPGADKSAYLRATDRAARALAAAAADQDLCTCCEIPLPRHLAASMTVCQDCIREGHRDVHGADRELDLARQHAERFRRSYLRQQDATEQAQAERRASIERSKRWVGILVRLMVEHQPMGRCSRCRTDPCPTWRRVESLNRGIALQIQNKFYPLACRFAR